MCKNYVFYYPDGKEINCGDFKKNRETFLNLYEQLYFFLIRNIKLENEIEKILKDGINKGDTEKIMLWKTGGKIKDGVLSTRYLKINMSYIYKIETTLMNKNNCDDLASVINKNNCDDLASVINYITNFDRVGFVYAVTLLHFVSKGKYPIYDKFAHIALKQISENSDFERIIKDSELEKEIHKDNAKKRFYEYQKHFIDRINDIFDTHYGEEESYDRRVDRALWVYGHLFNDNTTNKTKQSA